jgi:putative thioredoxin
MPGTFVKDVTAATFQKEVVDVSVRTPVLLDFWAAWCGPCRTLGPVLERLAEEFHGAFLLGKVDTEREQDLAYAFGVQGIPFCVLVDRGRPVDGFQGALPEAEVRKFLERNGIAQQQQQQQPEKATVTKVDPASPAGRLQRALEAARAGNAAATRDAVAGFPEEDPLFGSADRLAKGVAFFEAKLDAHGAPAEAALADARARMLARDYPAAMERILGSVAADRGFRKGLAREAMLLCFQLFGEDDERLDDYRRRLATLLY